jgi:hypothetical protein
VGGRTIVGFWFGLDLEGRDGMGMISPFRVLIPRKGKGREEKGGEEGFVLIDKKTMND